MNKHISSFHRWYDTNTIFLHWLTALIVIFQFVSAEFWDDFPRPDKHILILSHMSLGVLLSVILIVRVIWRLSFGIKISEAQHSLLDIGANALHILLYKLLIVQIPLGFFTRWTDNKPLDVFGLMIPSPLGPCAKTTNHFFDQMHDINAWVIIVLAGVHTLAALVHHFVWHDDVLRRMLPRRWKRF